jgi:fibronectin-binding autotransporter adhesin
LSNPVTFNGDGVARLGAGSPSNGTLTFSGAVSLGGASRTLDAVVNTFFTGTVSNGGITKQGAANLYLQAANTFSGLLDITSSGTVALEHVGAVNGAPSVNMSAGNLGIGAPFVGNTATIGNLTGTGGTITTQWNAGNGVRTLQVNQTEDGTFAGVLQSEGAGLRQLALVKTGTAALTLSSGSSNYSGGTTISQGTIIATNGNALGTSGTVTINNAGTGANNTSLRLGSVTLGRAITVANQGTGTVTLGANGSVALPTFSGAITLNKAVTLDGSTNTDRLTFTGGIGGTGDVTIAGASRVVFTTTANTYNGTTTISPNSILQLSDGTATATSFIPDTSVVTVNAGAFLKLAKGANSETIGGLSGTGTVRGHESVPGVASALVINNSGSHAFGGVLENGGALGATLSLTKAGSGMQTLSGNNTYSGATTISDGTLIAHGGFAIGDSSTVDVANLATAQLQVTHAEQIGALNGGGASGGNIVLSPGITLTTGNNNASTTYGGVISGVGASFNKRGTGTQTLTGASSFSGGVTIDNGVLSVDAIAASGNQPLGIGTGAIAMLNGSTLRFTGTSGTTGRGLTLSGTNGGQVDVVNAAGTLTLVRFHHRRSGQPHQGRRWHLQPDRFRRLDRQHLHHGRLLQRRVHREHRQQRGDPAHRRGNPQHQHRHPGAGGQRGPRPPAP